jgi:hypothetical protein
LSTFRFAESRLRFVRFADELDTAPAPDEDLVLRALPSHVAREEKKGTPAVSFVEYEASARRGKKGVLAVTALVYDFDHLPTERARAVVTRLRQLAVAYLLYSSFSHRVQGEEDNCFRVLLPLDRAVAPAEYARLWSAFNSDLGGHADPKARDVARLWYIPACPKERLPVAIYEYRDGPPLEVDTLLVDTRTVPDDDGPPPRRPLNPVSTRFDQARRIAQHRLNHDPTVRERAAERLEARVNATRASGIACPRCGRRSVWFWLDPRRKKTATCNHRNSCGWWGHLDVLLDAPPAVAAA